MKSKKTIRNVIVATFIIVTLVGTMPVLAWNNYSAHNTKNIYLNSNQLIWCGYFHSHYLLTNPSGTFSFSPHPNNNSGYFGYFVSHLNHEGFAITIPLSITTERFYSFAPNPNNLAEGIHFLTTGRYARPQPWTEYQLIQGNIVAMNIQRTESFVDIEGNRNSTSTSPVQDPLNVTLGRCEYDSWGDYRYTWRIVNVATGEVMDSGYSTGGYAAAHGTHTVIVSAFEDGLYRVEVTVYEKIASAALMGNPDVDFPNADPNGVLQDIQHTSTGYFRIGDPPPDEPTPTPATFTIYKDLLLPPGTDMPTDPFHFDFTATFLPDEFWPPVSNSPTNVQLAPQPIRIPFTYCMYYDYATSVTVGGVTYSSITQSTTIDLNAVNWPRPGIYTFRIAETHNSSGLHSTDGIAMDYDRTYFYLVVHVIFPDGDFSRPLEVSFFGISHSRVPHADYPNCPGIRDALGNFTCECTPGIDYSTVENKPRDVTFTNYLRRPPANTYFEVEKRLAGDMANTNEEYTITVYLYEDYTRTTLLPLATGADHPDAIYAYIYGYQRNATTGFVMPSEPKERVSRTRVTGLPHAANLRHGDTIRFSNVPVGTGFRVVEAYIPGYIQTASVVTGGGTATNVGNPATGVNLVASGTISALPQGTAPPAGGVFNYVTVTNAHDDTPPTGVFMQNVPFGLMVALGAGAMAAVGTVAIACKKKKQ